MVKLDRLQNYKDDLNNIIEYDGANELPVSIVIKGSNNKIKIHKDFKLSHLTIWVDCNNGYIELGNCSFRGFLRLGEDAKIIIKDNVSCTNNCTVTSMEGATVFIGEDCMIATNNYIRSDDQHPIFDVNTGERLNISKDIYI